ncbi:MAG: EAL domain-containing protein, partial [Burkholderiaceae bacterium]|nr:EAL domain-containing protein [Burkholderiaceae bacterium]
DIQNLLHCAKLALGSAHDSRHGVQTNPHLFFHPELLKQAECRRRLEDDLRLAVEQRELKLVFQPIVDLRTGLLAGAEALLRWQHAERGAISPEVFIPLAERIGLIGEIGRQVLNDACRQAAHWRRDGLNIYVSVNVSASQIPEELPPESILETLRHHNLPSQAIALEITEGVLMGNISVVQNWIAQLRAAGLRIYLDDFGTGYSSLSYLKRFPMDTVKVDKSFIMDMSDDHTLVDAIITMTGSLGLTVVAEGIEDIEQLDLLRSMGCGYGQGYLFSRPVAAADFMATAKRINTDMARSAA